MPLFDFVAVLMVFAAGFSYINFRWLRLPATIGSMALALVFSVAIVVAGMFVPEVERSARALAGQFDFNEALLHGMLGFLLFAGALHIDLGELAGHKWAIAVLASLGVLLSTAIVGGLTWVVLGMLGFGPRIIDCLLFGALISPTDPIAVLAILKQTSAPPPLEIQIAGESLFNDGIGVVVFTGLLEIAMGEQKFDVPHLSILFLREVVGGILFGLAIGWVVYRMLRSVDQYQVEIMLSLALVAGGYALAEFLHLSGPIAIVVAGLLIGNHGRAFAMSPKTNEHLDLFWQLVDEILNAILFVAIGLQVLALTFTGKNLAAGVLAIAVVLAARLVSVGLPVWCLRRSDQFEPALVPLLTWGGLRGAISVALALSLPGPGEPGAIGGRNVIVAMTYVVVVFSILVQGLTVGPLTRRWLATGPKEW